MNRRDFFRAAGVGLGLFGMPHLVRDAFAAEIPPTEALEALAAAFHRAHERGVPLLVLVIPADTGSRWFRGHAFGELLMHGPDDVLARLTEVEVACATMETLRLLVPRAPMDEPHMVLVQTDRVPAGTAALHPDLGSEESWWSDAAGPIDARIAAQAEALRRVLPKVPEARIEALAEGFRASLGEPVAGSLWGNATGCGTLIEGVERNAMYACGMGHVPSRSRRFLYFFDPDDMVF